MISLIILALLLATVVFSLFRWAEAIGYSKGVRDAAKIAGHVKVLCAVSQSCEWIAEPLPRVRSAAQACEIQA